MTDNTFDNKPMPALYEWVMNYAAFRFGQPISDDDREAAIHRNDLANWICMGLPRLAFQEGYDIVGKDKKKAPWSDEFTQLFDVAEAAGIDRGWGCVSIGLMDDKANGATRIVSFPPKNVTIKTDKLGNTEAYSLTEPIAHDKDDYTHIVPNPGKTKAKLEDVIHVVIRKGKYRYQGEPILDPCWDLIKGRTGLLEAASVFITRVAYGIKRATYHDRGSKPANDSIKAYYEQALLDFDSGNTNIVLMSVESDDSKAIISDKIEITQGEGGQFNFTEKQDLFHKALSLILGVPKNSLDGVFQGETVGARAVLELLYAAYRIMQKNWITWINMVASRWAALNNKEFLPDYNATFKPLVIMSEKEQADIDQVKAQTYAIFYATGIMELDEIREKLELEPRDIKRPEDDKSGKQDKEDQETDQEDTQN